MFVHHCKASKLIAVALSLLLALLIHPAGFASYDARLTDALDSYVDALNAACENLAGNGIVLVTKGGEIAAMRFYGMADRENLIPFSGDTPMPIGSVSKLFTAIAIMQLYEEGILTPEDRISKHLPDLQGGDQITVGHLLTHTAGVSNELADLGRILPLRFEPGTDMLYSNAGYQLLAKVVEAASGMRFESYMRRHVFKPASMHQTGFIADSRDIEGLAVGYDYSNGRFFRNAAFALSRALGSGNIYSTAHDMYLFDIALRSGRLLKSETLALMTTDNTGLGRNYGYGCFVGSLHGHAWLGHSGNLSSGFFSYYTRFPKDDTAVILLFNTVSNDNDTIMKSIGAIALNERLPLPALKERISMDRAALEQFGGRYRMPGGAIMTIHAGEGYLIVRSNDTIYLTPCASTEFFDPNHELWTHSFELNAEGSVCRYVISNSVDRIMLMRINEEP